ncbi:MAG: hypothetical protein R6U70_08490 [Bacillota bacterium]
MIISDRLNRIRQRPALYLSRRQRILRLLPVLALGATMGILAKHADATSILGDIGTELGVWVLTATILAAWSRSPEAAALNVLALFVAMLAAYYGYTVMLFNAVPWRYVLRWGGFALLSPIAGYIVWYSRGDGWAAALSASLPIALLLTEGYTFYYTRNMTQGLALSSALLLVGVLPIRKSQWVRIIPLAAALSLLISRTRLTNLLFGGL